MKQDPAMEWDTAVPCSICERMLDEFECALAVGAPCGEWGYVCESCISKANAVVQMTRKPA